MNNKFYRCFKTAFLGKIFLFLFSSLAYAEDIEPKPYLYACTFYDLTLEKEVTKGGETLGAAKHNAFEECTDGNLYWKSLILDAGRGIKGLFYKNARSPRCSFRSCREPIECPPEEKPEELRNENSKGNNEAWEIEKAQWKIDRVKCFESRLIGSKQANIELLKEKIKEKINGNPELRIIADQNEIIEKVKQINQNYAEKFKQAAEEYKAHRSTIVDKFFPESKEANKNLTAQITKAKGDNWREVVVAEVNLWEIARLESSRALFYRYPLLTLKEKIQGLCDRFEKEVSIYKDYFVSASIDIGAPAVLCVDAIGSLAKMNAQIEEHSRQINAFAKTETPKLRERIKALQIREVDKETRTVRADAAHLRSSAAFMEKVDKIVRLADAEEEDNTFKLPLLHKRLEHYAELQVISTQCEHLTSSTTWMKSGCMLATRYAKAGENIARDMLPMIVEMGLETLAEKNLSLIGSYKQKIAELIDKKNYIEAAALYDSIVLRMGEQK